MIVKFGVKSVSSAAVGRRKRFRAKMLAQAYPTRADGITLFPFRRLFIVARRA